MRTLKFFVVFIAAICCSHAFAAQNNPRIQEMREIEGVSYTEMRIDELVELIGEETLDMIEVDRPAFCCIFRSDGNESSKSLRKVIEEIVADQAYKVVSDIVDGDDGDRVRRIALPNDAGSNEEMFIEVSSGNSPGTILVFVSE